MSHSYNTKKLCQDEINEYIYTFLLFFIASMDIAHTGLTL